MEHAQIASDAQRLAESLGQLPEPVAKPSLIVVSGLPGTGKSHLCHKLAERLPLIILESDALRKVLFTPPEYNSQESSRLFRALHRLVKGLLKRGMSLILDATNLSEQHREHLYSIADHLDVKLVLVRVEAPEQIVRERFKVRQREMNSRSYSDADWTVYQRMKPLVQKIRRKHYAADTSRDITPVLDKIVKEVTR